MIEETFFCIRPYVFEEREDIKNFITCQGNGLVIKDSKIVWLSLQDIDVLYGIESTSTYYDACLDLMCSGFSEVGIVSGDHAIEKLIDICGDSFVQKKCLINTVRRNFGIKDPIMFDDFEYHMNPIHRACNLKEAVVEVAYYRNNILCRSYIQIIADMMENLYHIKGLNCVYNFHIKPAVRLGKELSVRLGVNPVVVEMALWLHDIGRLLGDGKEHHIQGSFYAEEALNILGIEKDIIQKICHCIKFHRANQNPSGDADEVKIVASADGITNIRYPSLLYYFAFNRKGLSFEAGLKEIQSKVDRSFKKISDFAKQEIEKEYQQWQDIFNFHC